MVVLLVGHETCDLQVLAGHHCTVPLGKLLTPVLCASVTKQYKLIPAKGVDLFGWVSNRGPSRK